MMFFFIGYFFFRCKPRKMDGVLGKGVHLLGTPWCTKVHERALYLVQGRSLFSLKTLKIPDLFSFFSFFFLSRF